MTRIAVVGLSLAGIRAAQALREQGYDDQLVLIGDESHLPYDRPPLSKEILAGSIDLDQISLTSEDERNALDAEWLLGCRATGLEPGVVRIGKESLAVDGIVVTTGARARKMDPTVPEGVHVLRTLDDALALRRELKTADRVVVVGAGFIGSEVASSAAVSLGKRVTLIDPSAEPLAGRIGPLAAGMLRDTYLANNVDVRFGAQVAGIRGRERVSHVELADGSVVEADLVVVGIGASPNTEWLEGSAVDCSNGVLTDGWGRTSMRRVVAAGDVARFKRGNGSVRVEHWTNARDMPKVAVRALLADMTENDPGLAHETSPYFWSDQFGVRLQLCGFFDPAAEMEIVEGSVADRTFVSVQHVDGKIGAVLGWSCPREFTRWRRRIGKPSVEVSPATTAN